MNAIEASSRLRKLTLMSPYIDNVIEMAEDDREDDAAEALRELKTTLQDEWCELYTKLSEVSI